jgi:hypothetical protein
MKNNEVLFKKLLDELKNNQEVCEEFKYLGTGNPLSNILIIGKEAAINIDSDQHRREIINNFSDWMSLKDFNSDKIKEKDIQNYSPLYPYKGQIFGVDTKKIKKGGTSKTWYNYQKLINFIFNVSNNQIINFHENSFITEVNSTPSEKTIDAIKDSIPFRKEHILPSDFFQSFPVVIISGVGYFDASKENNEIEKIFHVNFTEKKYANKDKQTQPFWIHRSKDKIVINTYQLSIGVSDILLREIAKEIQNTNLLR